MNAVTPSGFRDVLSEEARVREAITRAVADLFASRGYVPIETPTLEVMDVLRAGGRGPATPFKFFDSRGDLLAMRPDVTLQIARMCATRLANVPGPLRFRYTQRVFREAETENQVQARELTQCGVECIGEVGPAADAEIVVLFAEALRLAGATQFVLAMATVGVLRALLERSGAAEPWKAAVLDAYHGSDFVALDRLCDAAMGRVVEGEAVDAGAAAPAYTEAIRQLARIRGAQDAIDAVRALVTPLGCVADLDDFQATYDLLGEAGLADSVLVDFSVASSFNYYTGLVFEACSPYLGSPLGSGGRYDRIVRMIEESEKLKSTAEDKASRMADRLVPYTLGGTAVTYLLTRDVTKMLAVLMVDFSCALKLAIPVAVLSAMRESSGHHISVKGGRFLEAVAKADTIVFDKTGTLTYATPKVAQIVPFGGHREADMLRLAACLEEHYPHSMANAVVEEAKRRGLTHEEYHSQVQYVVAHGISSMVENKKVIIGSAHFVFEDEGCCIPKGEQEKYDALPAAYSHLYLCIDGELAAVICIHDPLRREAKDAVKALHESGFTNVVMMTGDNRRTAESVAAEVGVDAVYAEVLPEDKAAFIRQEKEKGHTVIMVGDGVNDSPALSEADAGIAISTGAAIAREIADITVASEDLFALVTLRRLGEALMERIHGSYRFIVGFNLTLIVLGVAGVLPPTTSALLHNGSTLGISLRNMTDLLDENKL